MEKDCYRYWNCDCFCEILARENQVKEMKQISN